MKLHVLKPFPGFSFGPSISGRNKKSAQPRRRAGRPGSESGISLASTLVMSTVIGIGAFTLLDLSQSRIKASHNRTDWAEGYYHTENAISWAVQRIADETAPTGIFSKEANTLPIGYFNTMTNTRASGFSSAIVDIAAAPSGASGVYQVTATSTVGKKTRTLRALVKKNPPSTVFDYEYFLNNWGWWWGSSISGYGDNRSNWDFDFRHGPTVNGSVVANGQITATLNPIDPLDAASVPLAGLAKADPVKYLKDGSPRVSMPNLKDFNAYQNLATARGGTLTWGTNVVSAVHTGTKAGLYLVGTDSNPITINGPVVIPGDVVIKGKITGIGTLYVGGHLYVAGDLTYKNGPDFSTAPDSMSTTSRDSWVANAISGNKDLVAFAVRESVLGGDVNSSSWKSYCYDANEYGLKNVGAEATLGADGIRGTGDDNVAYLDTNNDGIPDSAYYDADGDGVVDSNYSYDSNLKMTSTRASAIQGYPLTEDGSYASYSSVATGNFNQLQGIFYCNHATALLSQKSGMTVAGSVICRDEAMVFTGSLNMKYDPRVHSRYANDPNRLIDLGLPVANKVALVSLEELIGVRAGD